MNELQAYWERLLSLPTEIYLAILVMLLPGIFLWLWRPKSKVEKAAWQSFTFLGFHFLGWYLIWRDRLKYLSNKKSARWWLSGNQILSEQEIAQKLVSKDKKESGIGLGPQEAQFVLRWLREITNSIVIWQISEERALTLVSLAQLRVQEKKDPLLAIKNTFLRYYYYLRQEIQSAWYSTQRWVMLAAVAISFSVLMGIFLFFLNGLMSAGVSVGISQPVASVSEYVLPATVAAPLPSVKPKQGSPEGEKSPLGSEVEENIIARDITSIYSYAGSGPAVSGTPEEPQYTLVNGSLQMLVLGLAGKTGCLANSLEKDAKKCTQNYLRQSLEAVLTHLEYLNGIEEDYSFSEDFTAKLGWARQLGKVVEYCAGIYDVYVLCGTPRETKEGCQEKYQEMVDLQDKIDEILVSLPNEPRAGNDPLSYFKERIFDPTSRLEFPEDTKEFLAGAILPLNSQHPLAETLRLTDWSTPLPPNSTPGTPAPGETPLPTATVVSGNSEEIAEEVLRLLFEKAKNSVVMMGHIRQDSEAGGTAFFVSSDGLMITNYHVVDGLTNPGLGGEYTLDNLPVWFEDPTATKQSAKFLKADEEHDVALLQFTGSYAFGHLELGDSVNIKKGQVVCAAGHPFLSTLTVTCRTITNIRVKPELINPDGSKYYGEYDMIEVDVTLNPGNSGGPLMNLDGNVLGVNSMIKLKSGFRTVFEGIGYALPVDSWVKDLINQNLGR